MFTIGLAIDQQQRAEAVLEFAQRADGLQPHELPAVRQEIADRYLKRKAERKRDAISAYEGRVRYNTPRQAAQAFRDNKLSVEELKMHTEYFKILVSDALEAKRTEQRKKKKK